MSESQDVSVTDTGDTQVLPEDNPRSHELFAEFDRVVAAMKAHRSDDLVGAWHRLTTEIEETTFPELIMDGDDLVCPHCREQILSDGAFDGYTDLRMHDYDTSSYSLYRELDGVDTVILSGVNDSPAEWQTFYAEHECGAAVSIPPTITLILE